MSSSAPPASGASTEATDHANPNSPEYRPRRCAGASAATMVPAIPAVTISPAVQTAMVTPSQSGIGDEGGEREPGPRDGQAQRERPGGVHAADPAGHQRLHDDDQHPVQRHRHPELPGGQPHLL